MTNILEIQKFPLWEKFGKKNLPLSFDLEITARCNMNCRHCYINLPAGDTKAQANELTCPEILEIARQAVDLGTMWCLLSGGEPLLRDDFAEVYLGLKRLGLLVSVFTNCTLVTNDHVKLFKKYPPRDIEITVYGITKDTYEAVTRKPGSFERFRKGLELLQKAGVPIRLKAMAVQSNFHEQQEIAKFCRVITKDFFRFDPQLHLRFDADPKRNDEIRSERLSPAQVIALEEADQQRIDAMRKDCSNLINETFTKNESDFLFQCGAGIGSFTVAYDGRFRLCSSLWAEGTTCSLREVSLMEAWQELVPRVRTLKSQNPQLLTCRKCPLVNLCLWCPAHAHLETGKLDGSTSYFCEVAKKRAENIRRSR